MTDSKFYLDTAPFIYYLEKSDLYFEKIRHFFMSCYSKNIPLVTSAVTVEEYCVYPLAHDDKNSVTAFNTFLDGMGIDIIPVDKQIAFEAAKIRSIYSGFKALDAIHLATAKISGCSKFITNDKQLKQIKDIDVLTMDSLSGFYL